MDEDSKSQRPTTGQPTTTYDQYLFSGEDFHRFVDSTLLDRADDIPRSLSLKRKSIFDFDCHCSVFSASSGGENTFSDLLCSNRNDWLQEEMETSINYESDDIEEQSYVHGQVQTGVAERSASLRGNDMEELQSSFDVLSSRDWVPLGNLGSHIDISYNDNIFSAHIPDVADNPMPALSLIQSPSCTPQKKGPSPPLPTPSRVDWNREFISQLQMPLFHTTTTQTVASTTSMVMRSTNNELLQYQQNRSNNHDQHGTTTTTTTSTKTSEAPHIFRGEQGGTPPMFSGDTAGGVGAASSLIHGSPAEDTTIGPNTTTHNILAETFSTAGMKEYSPLIQEQEKGNEGSIFRNNTTMLVEPFLYINPKPIDEKVITGTIIDRVGDNVPLPPIAGDTTSTAIILGTSANEDDEQYESTTSRNTTAKETTEGVQQQQGGSGDYFIDSSSFPPESNRGGNTASGGGGGRYQHHQLKLEDFPASYAKSYYHHGDDGGGKVSVKKKHQLGERTSNALSIVGDYRGGGGAPQFLSPSIWEEQAPVEASRSTAVGLKKEAEDSEEDKKTNKNLASLIITQHAATKVKVIEEEEGSIDYEETPTEEGTTQPRPAEASSNDSLSCPSTGSSKNTANKNRKKRLRKPRVKVVPEVKVYVEPTDHDVLLGRGGKSNHHVGNKRYREEVENLKNWYRSIEDKEEKTDLSQCLVDYVHNYKGRFLERDSVGWFIVPNIVARRKASQALREDSNPKKRAEKRARHLKKKAEKQAATKTNTNHNDEEGDRDTNDGKRDDTGQLTTPAFYESAS